MFQKIRREIFTHEELSKLQPLIEKNDYKHLTDVIDDMTQEKEIELQRIINEIAPNTEGFESNVAKEMAKELPNGPQTPEEEEAWDQKLKDEYSDFAKVQAEKASKLVPARELEAIQSDSEKTLRAAQKLEKKENLNKKDANKLKETISSLQTEDSSLK